MAMAGREVNLMDGKKLDQIGEGMDILKEKLKRRFPTTDIAHVPPEVLLKIICCVRCGDIPHPDGLVMSCDQGHYTCGSCVQDRGSPQVNLEGCCADIRKLEKMGTHFLKDLLANCQFKCRNYERGCKESVSGDLVEEHYEKCKFTEPVKCRFHNCTANYAYLDDVLEHYKRDHQATILEGVDNSIVSSQSL